MIKQHSPKKYYGRVTPFRKDEIMKMKKIGSLLLAIIMVLTLFTCVFTGFTASATDSSLPRRIHFNGTNNYYGQKINTVLEANVEYTLEMKYKYADNSVFPTNKTADSADTFGFYKDNNYGYIRGYTNRTTSWPDTNHTNVTVTADKITITTTFPEEVAANTYYVGFQIYSGKELFVTDYALYKTSDPTTNLWPAESVNWNVDNNWTKVNDGSVVYTDDNDYIFDYTQPEPEPEPEPDPEPETPKMLKFEGTGNAHLHLGALTLAAGTDYTLSFRYNYEDGRAFEFDGGASKDFVAITKFGTSLINNAILSTQYTPNYSNITGKSIVDNVVTLNLNFAENVTGDTWITFGKVDTTVLYVGDLVLYATSDETKANLLPTSGTWQTNNGSNNNTVSWVDYNEELLTPVVPETMLHINTNMNTANKIGMKVAKDKLEGDALYTVRFDYKMLNGEYRFGPSGAVQFAVYSNQGDGGAQMQFVSCVEPTLPGLAYSYKVIDSDTVEITFKNRAEYEGTNTIDYYYIGFNINDACEFYVDNMVMYKADDENKTNLLPEAPVASDWKYGFYNYFVDGLPGNSAYVNEVEDTFGEREWPAFTKGDGNGIDGIDIRDLVAINEVISTYTYNVALDVNDDGTINAADIPVLRAYLLDIGALA